MLTRINQALARVTSHPGPSCGQPEAHAWALKTLALGGHAVRPMAWPFAGPEHVRQPLFEALATPGGTPSGLYKRMAAAMVQGAVDASVTGAVLGLCLYVRVHYGRGAASDFLWQHHLLLISAATFMAWPTLWAWQAVHHRL